MSFAVVVSIVALFTACLCLYLVGAMTRLLRDEY